MYYRGNVIKCQAFCCRRLVLLNDVGWGDIKLFTNFFKLGAESWITQVTFDISVILRPVWII